MDNGRYDSIAYDENWQSVPVTRAEPFNGDEEYFSDYAENDDISYETDEYQNDPPAFRKKENSVPQPVIKLQLVLSIIAISGLFLMKTFGGTAYDTAKNWYFENLGKSLVIDFKEMNFG